jgi:glycosyltransferase involved in cell wall biosynthesis
VRIAVFTDNDFEKVNGVTTTLRAVLAHAPADIEARIYTCQRRSEHTRTYYAARSLSVPMPFYGDMSLYMPRVRRLLAEARADRIDLIHLTTPGPVGLAAMYVAARMGVPMVGSFHTDLEAYVSILSGSATLGRVMREYMRWPYGRCAQVLVPSEATARLLSARGGMPASRLRQWRRGVSSSFFAPRNRSVALRRRWGASDDHTVALYVGRLSREKGLGLLPEIHRLMDGTQCRFVIVGEGPYRDTLERLLPDAIFTGALSHQGVAVAMASADMFVFPSRTDTAGNVVLEAQASGLPVLVTDAGGPRENMIPGETGEICNTAADFAFRLTEWARDPHRRLATGARARVYTLERDWAGALRPLYSAYRDVLASTSVASTVAASPARV